MVILVISDFNITEAAPKLNQLTNSKNETLICEVLTTLKHLNRLDGIDIDSVLNRIENPNIKAIIESLIK